MRAFFVLGAAAALLVSGTAATAKRLSPDERMVKALAGRVEGKPVDCITTNQIRSQEIIDKTAILFTMNNGTVYVQRPSGAEFLDDDDILVSEPLNGRSCSIDIVRLVDRTSRFPSGSLGYNKFVPYTKVKDTPAG